MTVYALMKHQVEGVKFLETVDGIGALLWDPGVGKTGATLAWVDQKLAPRYGEVRVLVVAPLTAADTWVLQPPDFMDSVVKARFLQGSTVSIMGKIRAAHDWAMVPHAPIGVNHRGANHNARVTILSVSAGAISSFCDERAKTIKMLRAVRAYAPHLIVVDESHIIKGAEANISKAMYQMGQLAPHRMILTGTVNPHSILDCYGQWRFLAPWTFSDDYGKPWTKQPLRMSLMRRKSIKPWSFGVFRDRYTTKGGYRGKDVRGYLEHGDFRARIAERSHVMRLDDAMDLPPEKDVDIHVTLSPRERKAYTEMHNDLAALLASGELIEAPNALAKIMKLRQITAGFIRDTDTEVTHVIGSSKRKAMCEIATVQLGGEQRVVLFGYFKSECALLAQRLAQMEPSTCVEVITGATSGKDRLDIRQRFGDVSRNPGRMILVAQARTMSVSVNELVTAQHAVYGSYSERRNDWVQARGRFRRKGQTKPVTHWNVFVPGSIDQVMLDRHKDRGNLEKALLDHIRNSLRL